MAKARVFKPGHRRDDGVAVGNVPASGPTVDGERGGFASLTVAQLDAYAVEVQADGYPRYKDKAAKVAYFEGVVEDG